MDIIVMHQSAVAAAAIINRQKIFTWQLEHEVFKYHILEHWPKYLKF